MRQDYNFTNLAPHIEEEQPSQDVELDHSASVIVPADKIHDPYGDDQKFNGFYEDVIIRRDGPQKHINSIEEVSEQETLNTFESER